MDAHSLNEPSVRHYLRFNDLSRDECDDLFERARALKQKFRRHETTHTLRDRTLALLFEKIQRARGFHSRRALPSSADMLYVGICAIRNWAAEKRLKIRRASFPAWSIWSRSAPLSRPNCNVPPPVRAYL